MKRKTKIITILVVLSLIIGYFGFSSYTAGIYAVKVYTDTRYQAWTEIQVFGENQKVIEIKNVTQSSKYKDSANTDVIIDGTVNGIFTQGNVAHTNSYDLKPWTLLKLKTPVGVDDIKKIHLYGERSKVGGPTFSERYKGLRIELLGYLGNKVKSQSSLIGGVQNAYFATFK